MTAEIMINKVVITEEAKFDYEEVVGCMTLPKTAIKNECEEYIDNMQKGGLLLYDYYFRVKYLDENSDKMLMLFFYKGEKFGKMQMWKLSGICEADDWTDELEYDGNIRNWLKASITEFPKDDWVLDLRVRENRKQRLLEEIENENYGEDYARMVKELLKKYRVNKMRIAVANASDVEIAILSDKMSFIDKCIDSLDDEAKELIVDIYCKGLSLKKSGEKHGYTKTGMQYRKDRAVEMMQMLFQERYES